MVARRRRSFQDRLIPARQASTVVLWEASDTNGMEEDPLMEIAQRLRLEVFDLEEGIFGFGSQDLAYGLEVVQTCVRQVDEGLGLVLTELACNSDGRGLVLVSEVGGNAGVSDPPIQVGDVICGVRAGEGFRERTTGLNYDRTVDIIGRAKQVAATSTDPALRNVLFLELNRLVKRARVQVEVDNGSGEIQTLEALAGENLRRLLLRKGIKLYDSETKRFDMPYATGDCAGEGLCGTCLVALQEGMDGLSPKDNVENLITQGRPLSWRASCRTVVGFGNRPASIRLLVKPQSNFQDERDPGVRPVSTD